MSALYHDGITLPDLASPRRAYHFIQLTIIIEPTKHARSRDISLRRRMPSGDSVSHLCPLVQMLGLDQIGRRRRTTYTLPLPQRHRPRTMPLMPLIDDIRSYLPFNEQEAADRAVILRQLESDPSVFDRSSLAHMTCSIWTVDPTATKTLMVFHNTYSSWSWIGGHADGERDLAKVALRELEEETGVANARLVTSCGPGRIYSLEVLTVNGHEKRGAYVNSHLHLNVTYLAVASPDEPLCVKADENSGVRWMDLDEALAASAEPWMRERIYRKLVDKLGAVAVE